MTGKIFLMNEFNENQVIDYFNLSPERKVERAAMGFMYHIARMMCPPGGAESLQKAAEIAINNIEFRHALYREFQENFFLGSPINQDALAIAVICDKFIIEIHRPDLDDLDEGEEDNHEMRFHHGMDEETIVMANTFAEEAMEMEGGLIRDENDPYMPESIFLAHINLMQSLSQHEANIDADLYDEDDLSEILDVDLPAAKKFILPDTDIGGYLTSFIAHMEQELPVYLGRTDPPPPSNEEPTPSRNEPTYLRLVPKPETP